MKDSTALTHRERSALSLLAGGQTNKEIAESLDIALRTAEYRVTKILRKLNVKNRTEAALWALRRADEGGEGDR